MYLEICPLIKGLNFPVCTDVDLINSHLQTVSKASNVGLWIITGVIVGVVQLYSIDMSTFYYKK